jgi:DNA-binding CsgD family transcriptional regulator
VTSRLLELVGEAYAFEDLDEFRPGILELLNRAVPSLWVSYNEVGSAPDQVFALSLPHGPDELMREWARFAHENPLIIEYLRTGDGRPRRFSDVIDAASFRKLPLYREFYRSIGVESQIAFTLPARPPLLLGLALSRGPEDYTDAEAELLALARPHLIQAYRKAELSSARAAALRALEGGLEGLNRHVVVVDPYGRVEFATEGARRLLGHANTLPDGINDWLAGARLVRPMADPLGLSIGGASVLVRLLPGGRADRRDVLLLEPGTGELSVEALRGLPLTRRQAEVLRLVAIGRSPDQAAADLSIARRTLDKHLQRVYAALGVTSLSQAASTAWAAVGVGA